MTINPFALLGMLVDTLLPDPIANWLGEQVEKINALLQGETARVIGYGAGVVIWIVGKMFGAIPDVPFDQAVAQAVLAIALLAPIVESIRHYVFSPATVAAIVNTPPTAAGPIAAAEAVGVDTSQPTAPIVETPEAVLEATAAPDDD